MRLANRSGIRATWMLMLAGCTTWALSAAFASPAKSGAPTDTRDPAQTMPVTGSARPNEAEIKSLESQIRTLREQLHSQVDALQSQIKALHDKYDPQIQGLESQKKTLVESGKTAAIQQLDQQEDAELAALADREKSEIEKVHQQTAAERKEIQQKYDALRKGAHS